MRLFCKLATKIIKGLTHLAKFLIHSAFGMRIYFFIFLLTEGFLFSDLNAQTGPDDEMGVLGIKLGEVSDSIHLKLKFIGKTRKLYKYRPEPDSLYYEGILLSSVRILFFNNKVHTIAIKTPSESTTEKVLASLQRKYGNGESLDQFNGIINWTGAKVWVHYEKNFLTGEGIFNFVSLKVNREYEIAEYNRVYGDD